MKNHEGMIRGFYQLSKSYYGAKELAEEDYVDEIMFGFYHPEDNTTTGEVCMRWVVLSGKIFPKLSVYNDAWSALSKFQDLLNLMGEHDSENLTPEQFCQLLLKCNFVDKTITTNPRIRGKKDECIK